MQLHSRSVGAKNNFFLFERLPVEVRYLIWEFTLEPRVVDLDYDFYERQHFDPSEDRYYSTREHKYVTHATVPVALQVCRDSRNATLPFYPFCFGSSRHSSKIRFNFSLDTLYLHESAYLGDREVVRFLRALSPVDSVSIRNIAISEFWGDDDGEDNDYEDDELTEDADAEEYRTKLGICLGGLRGLRNILVVHNVSSVLNWFRCHSPDIPSDSDRYYELQSLESAISNEDFRNYFLTLFGDFPVDLNERAKLSEEEICTLVGGFEPHLEVLHENDKIDKITRHVYGWWRPKHPESAGAFENISAD